MKTITVNNIKVHVIGSSFIQYKGRNGFTELWVILCTYCNKPKNAQADNVLLGVSLMHRSCALKVRYEKTRDTKEKQTSFIVSRTERIYKLNARNKKREYTLSISNIADLIFANCFYCGVPPNQQYENYDVLYNGIDRKNSKLGYIMENCVPCCNLCNRAKMHLSIDKFMKWLDRIARFNGYIKEIKEEI